MGDQVIRIQDGLPALPGTNITMPEHPTMNGHQILSSTGAAPFQKGSNSQWLVSFGSRLPDAAQSS
jgi:hypothetical protein